jgi:hypothetical protein
MDKEAIKEKAKGGLELLIAWVVAIALTIGGVYVFVNKDELFSKKAVPKVRKSNESAEERD